MTEPNIQQICDGLSVCVSCYEKIQRHLMSSRNRLCHICFTPVPWDNESDDYASLRWIGGEEQVICCGKDSCEEEIRMHDRIMSALEDKNKTW